MRVYIVLIDKMDKTIGTIIGTEVNSVWDNFDSAAERVQGLLHIGEDTISYPYINVQTVNNEGV